jgi:hypothetical protein
VADQLVAYAALLDFIEADVEAQFALNVLLLAEVRFNYTDFLLGLRQDALAAEADEIDNLHLRLTAFHDTATANRLDTHARLGAFAELLPASRVTGYGVNSDLVDFTISPISINAPNPREARVALPDQTPVSGLVLPPWAAAGVLGVVLVGVLIAQVAKRQRRA